MGTLTDDMTRLRREIKVLRDEREGFVKDLRTAVPKILATYRKAHAQEVEQTTVERRASVYKMLAAYRKTHVQMAEQTAVERRAFVSDLRKRVSGVQREIAADLASFRQAWYGPGRAEGEWPGEPQSVETERPRGGRKGGRKGGDG